MCDSVSVEVEFLFFSCNIDTISFWNSFRLSVKDVTEIVTLLILILKLIAKLCNCIRYFKRGGWQQDGGDGTTNNKMGIESDISIVASVKASTYICRKWCSSCIQYSFLLLLRIPCYFCFFLQRLGSIRLHGCFLDRETSFFWGRHIILVDVVLWAQ